MGKYRIPSERSKYYLPKQDYLTAIHFSLRYPLWEKEIKELADTSKAIAYDKDKVQTSGDYDSTFEAAVKLSECKANQNMKLVDEVIALVADGLDKYLRGGVCFGLNFNQLKGMGMPCERDYYYQMRRHYYYELIKRI